MDGGCGNAFAGGMFFKNSLSTVYTRTETFPAMKRHQTIRPASRWLYIVSLLLLVVAYRLFAAGNYSILANTAPVMAVCFGGGLLLGRGYWWVPALLMIGSDIVLGLASDVEGGGLGAHTLFTVIFFTVIAYAASQFGSLSSWWTLLGGTLLSSVLFYLAANTYAWIGMAEVYPQTLAGWWQSQSIGLPGYPPSWHFLRNALIGDAIWCLLASPLFFWKSLRSPAVRFSEVSPVAV